MLLTECTMLNTPSMNDFIEFGLYDAKVLKVYDGDTIWVAYENKKLGLIKAKVRFNRINAAEIKKRKGQVENEEQKSDRLKKAHKARDFVDSVIGGKLIKINITSIDTQYDRLLADILVTPEQLSINTKDEFVDLSNFMLLGGLVEKY